MQPSLKKPRKDSKLEGLTPDQQQQLTGWLVARMDYGSVLKLIEDQFGLKSSLAALSRFYKKNVGPYLIERRRAAVGVADAVEAEAAKRPDLFDHAAIRNLRERAFTMSCDPSADTGEVLDVFRVLLKREELDHAKSTDAAAIRQKEEQLAIARATLEQRLREYQDKVATAKAAMTATINKGGLSPDTRREIEEQLKLL